MISSFGKLLLLLAFVVSIYSLFAFAYGIYSKDRRFIQSGRYGFTAILAMVTAASGFLIYALVTHDFSIKYVANYTSTDLPLFYTVSAFWAGQAGSLLFWALILALFATIVVWQTRKYQDSLYDYVAVIIGAVQLFFIFLVALISNPFTLISPVPFEGQGLNPLLQNPGMIFHPPTLFLGYVGFTIPFAYAIAALILERTDSWWIKKSRRWTIFSWIFLTIGIILGAWWAYVELGWGGYWGWDPVENASFMPWLTATAYLHSVMIQERRKMLKGWNVALIALTFELCLFGTLLVRSGILSSVHAFGESTLGSFFVFFILSSSLFVIVLASYRTSALKGEGEFDALLSRESSFLLNNLILTGIMFAVFWGTLFPLISEVITGNKISVKAPFFNQVSVPLGIALLILIGICPLISWRKATWSNFQRNFIGPLITATIASIVAFIFGIRTLGALLTVFGATFVTVTIGMEFYRGVKTRVKLKGENIITGFLRLFAKQKRRYGGYLIHLGVVVMFIGLMASNAFQQQVQKSIKIGDAIRIRNYKIVATKIKRTKKRNAYLEGVVAKIYQDGKHIHTLFPSKAYYKTAEQPSTEVAVHSNIWEDVYMIFAGSSGNNYVTLKVVINPFVGWIWGGSWVMLLGGIIAILEKPRRERKQP